MLIGLLRLLPCYCCFSMKSCGFLNVVWECNQFKCETNYEYQLEYYFLMLLPLFKP